MIDARTEAGAPRHGTDGALVRLGGLAIVAALAIHVVLNLALKTFPPEDPAASELRDYLAREAGTWAIVHGFRYVAFACIALFAAGLYARVRTGGGSGWGVLGLLGTAVWVANGVVTNGIEMLAFLDVEPVAARPELFRLLFRLTRVLFTAEVAAWAVTILGFSIAGWRARAMPRWLSILGILAATGGTLSGVFVVSVIHGGPATGIIEAATLASLLWFLCTGIHMAVRGAARRA